MLKLKDIQQVHVELTTRCNARCPMCPRNYRGYDYNSGYPITELSLGDFKKIFNPEILKQLRPEDPGVSNTINDYGVTFNGNLGDFSSARDGVEIVEYLVEHGISVSICTNGSARNAKWWERLALPGVEIGFAIDGLADTHSLYRQDTNWHHIIDNAQAFIAAGGRAVWRFIPFDHNRHQESKCQQLAQDMGFYRFENIYDGRDRTPVFTRTGKFSHRIGNPLSFEVTSIPELKPLLESHKVWPIQVLNMQHPKDQPNVQINCIHKRRKEIYVAADGSVYPCCFMGFYPGQMSHPGNQQLEPVISENNALLYPLDHCLEWFDSIENTWSKPSIQGGRLLTCVNTCGSLS
jgi:MoaA/NifB/PqqE/SkfB family radical SAM enzyme